MSYTVTNYDDAVKELALSLPDGCTDGSCACPNCGRVGSFNITRDGNILKYICFRVACTCYGNTGSRGTNTGVQTISKKVKLFDGELTMLTDQEYEYLSTKFRIPEQVWDSTRYCERDGRVYFPQYHISGQLQGYIARHYPALTDKKCWGAKALWKAVLPIEGGLLLPHMSVLSAIHTQKRVVLVEDWPSAQRINSQLRIPTCCLGGTSLYSSHIDTLIDMGVEQVIPVLDADAVVKAVKMCKSMSLCFDTMTLPLTGCDPKDMTFEELYLTFQPLL